MVRKRCTGEQIIAVLNESEAGAKTGELCRKHGMSEATFYKWKAKYAGLMLNELKRLRSLEDEDRHLKQIVAPAGVGQLVSQGVAGKKLLNPKVRKMAASYATESLGLSERRAPPSPPFLLDYPPLQLGGLHRPFRPWIVLGPKSSSWAASPRFHAYPNRHRSPEAYGFVDPLMLTARGLQN